MAPELIEVDEARGLVLEHVRPLPGEHLPVREALGRVLAEDVKAAEDVPGFDNSAMDGFAVLAADTEGARSERPVELTVVDESRAGRPAGSALAPGQAIRISTGAMLPPGADAVVRVEDTAESDGQVQVRVEAAPGGDVRRAGEDIRAGNIVLRAGARLGPAELGVLASVGRPGRSAIPQKTSRMPSSAKAGFTWSYSPTETPPQATITSASSARRSAITVAL